MLRANRLWREEEVKSDIKVKGIYIFDKLAGLRERQYITSSKFEKMAAIKGVTNEYLKKVDFAIVFIGVTLKQHTMSFIQFFM